MLFLVAALLLLGTFIGTPAFLPLPATAVAATRGRPLAPGLRRPGAPHPYAPHQLTHGRRPP